MEREWHEKEKILMGIMPPHADQHYLSKCKSDLSYYLSLTADVLVNQLGLFSNRIWSRLWFGWQHFGSVFTELRVVDKDMEKLSNFLVSYLLWAYIRADDKLSLNRPTSTHIKFQPPTLISAICGNSIVFHFHKILMKMCIIYLQIIRIHQQRRHLYIVLRTYWVIS